MPPGLSAVRPSTRWNPMLSSREYGRPSVTPAASTPGCRRMPLEPLLEQPVQRLRILVALVLQGDRRGRDVDGSKPGIEAAQVHERPHQQAGADEQHHAQRDFRDDENAPPPVAAAAGDRRACPIRRGRA